MKKKFLKIISCEVFESQILVGVSCNYEDYLKYAKNSTIEGFIKFIEENKKTFNNLAPTDFTIFDTDNGWGVLGFRDFKDDWEFYEILLHELSHLVDFIAEQKMLSKETEAKAYLLQYLFRNIRRAIQDYYLPKKKNETTKKIRHHRRNRRR